jgi:hypothetical protein
MQAILSGGIGSINSQSGGEEESRNDKARELAPL